MPDHKRQVSSRLRLASPLDWVLANSNTARNGYSTKTLRAGGSTRGGFENGEGGALRVGDDRNAAHVFKIRRRHIELGAKIFCGRSSGVTVGSGEVRQPVSGSAGLEIRSRGNTADEFLAVHDVPVIVSLFVFLQKLPAE